MIDEINDQLLAASHPTVSGERVRYVLLRKGAQILLDYLQTKGGYTQGFGDGYDAFQGGAIKLTETATHLERERIKKVLKNYFPSNRAGYIVGENTLNNLFKDVENG